MKNSNKSYAISKLSVWESWQQVKRKGGGAGIDGQTIEDYEKSISRNLYKLWNRMSSGSYFPQPVKMVEIPKSGGGKRVLGIPTVEDRVAQSVVRNHIEPKIDILFDESSFGYRPKRSAHQALEQVRLNCWKYPMVVDIDIRGFFDNIDHGLLMKCLKRHTEEKWVLLYVSRWLQVSSCSEVQSIPREKGTPQGGVISPLLANLYLHYSFDKWMRKTHSGIEFERYADDVIVHCKTVRQAQYLLGVIGKRFTECKLSLQCNFRRSFLRNIISNNHS